MKNFKFGIISLLTLSLGFSSCREYLEVKPYGSVIPTTPEEFAAILHDHLNTLDAGDENYILGNATILSRWDAGHGDDFELSLSTQAAGRLDKYVGDLLNTASAYTPYRSLYKVVRDCNIILGELPESDNSEQRKVRATSHALRAVAYYQLMRLYCQAPELDKLDEQLGLPLPTSFDLEHREARSTLSALISRIESDLKEAIALGNEDKTYRFTTDVCRGYLARLYFWTERWQAAADLSAELLTKYPLLESDAYKQMHTASADLRGNQLIKAYRLPSQNQSEVETTSVSVQGRPISRRLLSLFEGDETERDIRYSLWSNKKRLVVKPYFCGMRSAEFLLIRAEALAHLGQSAEALALVNQLRSLRIRDAVSLSLDALPAASSDELIKQDASGKALSPLMACILRERRKELFFEGDRFFELKRNGSPSFVRTYNGTAYTTESYMYTYPLPSLDVQLSGLVQNPGYTELISE